MSVDGVVDTTVFRPYVEQALVPTLVPGDVVMDNLSTRKVCGIREAI